MVKRSENSDESERFTRQEETGNMVFRDERRQVIISKRRGTYLSLNSLNYIGTLVSRRRLMLGIVYESPDPSMIEDYRFWQTFPK